MTREGDTSIRNSTSSGSRSTNYNTYFQVLIKVPLCKYHSESSHSCSRLKLIKYLSWYIVKPDSTTATTAFAVYPYLILLILDQLLCPHNV